LITRKQDISLLVLTNIKNLQQYKNLFGGYSTGFFIADSGTVLLESNSSSLKAASDLGKL
jgi:hypothetical protein